MWRLLLLCAASTVNFDLPATDGMRHGAADLARSRALVLVFLSIDCPISNRYAPVLQQLETEYRGRAKFLAVFSDSDLSAESAAKHLKDFSLQMPGLLDPGATLARQTGAHVTPEVAVLSPAGFVLYRGRIDDRYVDWGKTRAQPTHHDLQDALNAALAGRPVAHPVTKALGCAIPTR